MTIEHTAAALARIAAANTSDPETDDLTIPLAIELGEVTQKLSATVKALQWISDQHDCDPGAVKAADLCLVAKNALASLTP